MIPRSVHVHRVFVCDYDVPFSFYEELGLTTEEEIHELELEVGAIDLADVLVEVSCDVTVIPPEPV